MLEALGLLIIELWPGWSGLPGTLNSVAACNTCRYGGAGKHGI